jgi:hypothetical protein
VENVIKFPKKREDELMKNPFSFIHEPERISHPARQRSCSGEGEALGEGQRRGKLVESGMSRGPKNAH